MILKRIVNILTWVITVCFLVLGILIGVFWFCRAKLPYNSEGKYYDAQDSVVYDDYTDVLPIFCFPFLMPAIKFLFLKIKSLKKKPENIQVL